MPARKSGLEIFLLHERPVGPRIYQADERDPDLGSSSKSRTLIALRDGDKPSMPEHGLISRGWVEITLAVFKSPDISSKEVAVQTAAKPIGPAFIA